MRAKAPAIVAARAHERDPPAAKYAFVNAIMNEGMAISFVKREAAAIELRSHSTTVSSAGTETLGENERERPLTANANETVFAEAADTVAPAPNPDANADFRGPAVRKREGRPRTRRPRATTPVEGDPAANADFVLQYVVVGPPL